MFAWEHAKHIHANIRFEKGTKIYEVKGPLFFGSIQTFADLFTPKEDPQEVFVDFNDARVYDHSGLEAIDALAERYARAGKTLHLRHLSQECGELLKKAGDLLEVNLMEDPSYHVADDRWLKNRPSSVDDYSDTSCWRFIINNQRVIIKQRHYLYDSGSTTAGITFPFINTT